MDFSSNIASQLNAGTILPEGIVIITLISILVGDLIGGRNARIWLPYGAIIGLFASLISLCINWNNPSTISFLGSFNGDHLSIIFRAIIALSTIITISMSIRYVEQTGTPLAEFIVIILTATLGGMFLSGANELVMIFISMEMLSISSYLMTGYMKRDPRSNEAALKYLLIGASSTAIFLYGASLLYGLSGGETILSSISSSFIGSSHSSSLELAVALVFMIAVLDLKYLQFLFISGLQMYMKDHLRQ